MICQKPAREGGVRGEETHLDEVDLVLGTESLDELDVLGWKRTREG